jgi:AraC-like DNA-binding protein
MAATPDRILRTLVFPIQYLEIGEALARELGQDIDDLYRACGIDLPRPFMPWHTMNGLQMKRSLEHFLSVCPPGEPPVVPFMAHFPLTTHGPLGMLAITSANLGEALHGALRYASLVMPAFRMHQEDVGDEVHIVVEPNHDFGAVHDFFTETVVLALTKVTPFLKQPIQGATVHFRHAALGAQADYERAFAGRFQFGCARNKLVIPRQALGIPLIAPSKASHMMMKATLEQQRLARLDTRPITQEVKAHLRVALRKKTLVTAESLAQALTLSPRTLSRRLQEEGSTLPQLKHEISLEHARVLLRESQLNVQQIAQATGFADAASFARAFKRATGQTPSEARHGQDDAPSALDTPQDSP